MGNKRFNPIEVVLVGALNVAEFVKEMPIVGVPLRRMSEENGQSQLNALQIELKALVRKGGMGYWQRQRIREVASEIARLTGQ